MPDSTPTTLPELPLSPLLDEQVVAAPVPAALLVPSAPAGPAGSTGPPGLGDLLRAAREHGGLPSVGHTLARLMGLLQSDDEAVKDLADLVLADLALTQRVLQLANTVPYRTHTPGTVTTVTRAIVLLGFDRVRVTVSALVLLDGLVGSERGRHLRGEFRAALVAGELAHECLAGVDSNECEEAAIGAMFRSVGRLLLGVFLPGVWSDALDLARRESIAESKAVKRVFGHSIEELTEALLREWCVPDRILVAVQPLPPRIAAPRGGAERVRVAAQFADEIATALRRGGPQPRHSDLAPVLDRYARVLPFDVARLKKMIETALERADEFEAICRLPPTPLLRKEAVSAALSDLVARAPSAQRDAVGRPANSRALLVSGLDEASRAMIAEGPGAQTLNEVIVRVLEAIRTALGYRRCAMALRDAASGSYRVRICSADEGQPGLAALPPTPLTLPAGQPLHARMTDGEELQIADLAAARWRGAIPALLERDLGDARSLLFVPLLLPERPLGFIVAERPLPDPDGASAEEIVLLRALRNQVLIAIRLRSRDA